MNPQLRQVRKLRLRSSDENLNRRGAILIEDALRTASLPDSGGARVLVIRKLSLGRISANHASISIALRIESLCRDLEMSAVHALSPEAIAAPAVYFDDDLEPYALLAVRIACNLPVDAWFWPLAAKGWNSGMPRDEAMRVLLRGALASSVGPLAALTLMRALARHRAIHVVADSLRQGDGEILMRAFEWSAPARALPFLSTPAESADPPSAPLEQMALTWFSTWGSQDARSLWLASVLYAIERPILYAQPALLVMKAAAWIEASSVPIRERLFDNSERASDDDSIRSSQSSKLNTAAIELGPYAAAAAAEIQRIETSAGEPHHAPGFRPRTQRVTMRAGLFYIVPVLQRLGITKWLQDNAGLAAWNIPHLVLRAIAERLETSPYDPVFDALGDPAPSPPLHVQLEVQEWLRRVRRFLRRTAGIGLYSAVCRSGRLALTETHVDVLFDLHRIDIRIRRCGLDINPGWVSWLERVILFHYVDLEDTHV